MHTSQDSDKSRAVSERPRPPQDARVDGRVPSEVRHNPPSSRGFHGDHFLDHTPQPSPGRPSDPAKEDAKPDWASAAPEMRERRETTNRRFGHHSREPDVRGRGGRGRGWDQRREYSGGRGGGRGSWDDRDGDGRDRGWGRGGRGGVRGDSSSRDGDGRVWERGVRPVVARTDHGRGGGPRGGERELWGGGEASSSSRRGASPLDGAVPAPGPSLGAAAAAAPGGIGVKPHPSPVAGTVQPSPVIGPAVATEHGDNADSHADKDDSQAPPDSAWGRSAPPPPPSPPRQDVAAGRMPRARGPSFSGANAGGEGDDIDDREAIRARDERERDLAVRQRRNADLGAKAAAGEVDPQKRGQREAQEKKEADREREKVGGRSRTLLPKRELCEFVSWDETDRKRSLARQ